ncbi:hypothetical protein [Rhodanobacter sp. MP7CTX1]|uniref:hypothetical protein n=1 Tax=Rhodanobacter sp. MP7CTX1 TaxID=2723084 RepID=UPI001615E4CD|nr:hypothetical protein [Rhodanobacter sp. MP7CTX1]MBB6186342.1 hypothetical protein [Rhodanobacter sp. MP7CTX1]
MGAVAEVAGVPDAGGWLLLQPTKATALAQNSAPVAFRIHDLLYIGTISLLLSIRAMACDDFGITLQFDSSDDEITDPIPPIEFSFHAVWRRKLNGGCRCRRVFTCL